MLNIKICQISKANNVQWKNCDLFDFNKIEKDISQNENTIYVF
jgi:hypothetical protein